MVSWPQALFKLVFFCILVPAILTFLHLNHAQQHSHLLFVGPVAALSNEKNDFITSKVSSFADLHGMYQGIADNKSGAPPIQFHQVLSLPRWWHVHWPSIAHVSTILATPTSTLLKRHSSNGSSSNTDAQVVYDASTKRWCVKSPLHQICSMKSSKDSEPASGIWSDGSSSIQVEYHSTITPQTTSAAIEAAAQQEDVNMPLKFRRNPNKKSKANRNLQQVLDRPTTTLLIAINVGIALVYWNRGTPPSSVAKIYNQIVIQGEYWRAFSGAFAHFDPLHIGFNMMTLYSLGMELEPSYGSISFLFYNLSLIPITTSIMMLIVYLQIRHSNNAALGETSTVGYSGVLFAWMVIASLERPQTCPIPFFPDVCFATHQFWGVFRFNVGPIVQLFVMQFLLKRVSFVGHLAGIVAGFLLHWNLLPLELVQPAVLIPAMYLGLLWRARKVIPITSSNPASEESCDDNVPAAPQSGGHGSMDGRRRKRERNEAIHKLLLWTRSALLVNVVLSALVFDVLGGMFLSPILGFMYFQYCVKSHYLLSTMSRSSARGDSTEHTDEKTRLGTLWKGFILSSVLTIVCDSMSLSGWYMSSAYWQSDNGTFVRFIPACCILLIGLLIQVLALIVACKSLADIGETGGGLFVVVFGSTVLDNARIVGTAIQARWTRSNWNAFDGQGVSLGGSSALSSATEGSSSPVV